MKSSILFTTLWIRLERSYCAGWKIDVVILVTIVHEANLDVKRNIRRPLYTTTNKKHAEKVWEEDYIKEIIIPAVIDDYNYWILGVYVAEQTI